MNQLNAQYQQSILHNSDTGIWNITLAYIKDIRKGNWGDTLYFASPKEEEHFFL